MNVYKQMEKIVESTKGLKSGPNSKYLDGFQVDFDAYDKDLIENHYAAGSKLLWIIKGSGNGTELFNARSKFAETMMSPSALREGDMYFTIDLTGVNEGTVKLASLNQAKDFVDHYQGTPGPVPRRISTFDQVCLALGYDRYDASPSKLNALANDLNMTTGEAIYLKIEPLSIQGGKNAQVTMAKPKLLADPKGVSRTKKKHAIHTLESGRHLSQSSNRAPRYVKITPHKNEAYADMESISKRSFDYAVAKLRKESPEFGL